MVFSIEVTDTETIKKEIIEQVKPVPEEVTKLKELAESNVSEIMTLDIESLEKRIIPNNEWSNKKFSELSNMLHEMTFDVDITKIDLVELKQLLVSQGDFLTRLLENPTLFEHETFTELLRTVFHLYEELSYRKNINTIFGPDLNHIKEDIKRCYAHLVFQWLIHMNHLKSHYPYLYSLAVRTNPFDTDACIEIRN